MEHTMPQIPTRGLAALVGALLGVILIIIFIGLAVDKSLFAPTERFMHRRWGTERA